MQVTVSTLETNRPPTEDADEFENRAARVATFYLLYALTASSVIYLVVIALLAPSNLRLPGLALGVVLAGAELTWAVRRIRTLAYRVRLTPSGLELSYPLGAPDRVSWPEIERIHQQGSPLLVYRRAGRCIRIPDDGPFAQRVVDTARGCGVAVDPPSPA
jgi:hypothetical protein